MVTRNFKFETLTPLKGIDEIYKNYATTFGTVPNPYMFEVVEQTKEDLFIWWAANREEIREALVLRESASI